MQIGDLNISPAENMYGLGPQEGKGKGKRKVREGGVGEEERKGFKGGEKGRRNGEFRGSL